MLNDNIKSLISGTINLYENSNLNQAIIDEGFQKLKQVKKILTEDNKEPSSNLKDEYDKQYNIHKNDNVAALELPYVGSTKEEVIEYFERNPLIIDLKLITE